MAAPDPMQILRRQIACAVLWALHPAHAPWRGYELQATLDKTTDLGAVDEDGHYSFGVTL